MFQAAVIMFLPSTQIFGLHGWFYESGCAIMPLENTSKSNFL